MDEFLRWLGFGQDEPEEETTVSLPAIYARRPGEKARFAPPTPRVQEALDRPFAADTLQALFEVPIVVGSSWEAPAGGGMVIPTRQPHRVHVSPTVERSDYVSDKEIEQLLTHEMTHSAHMQGDPGIAALLADLRPVIGEALKDINAQPQMQQGWMTGHEFPHEVTEPGYPPGVYEMSTYYDSPAVTAEYFAFLLNGALDAVRNRTQVDSEEWERRVDFMESRRPGTWRAIEFIDDRLKRQR